MGHGREVSATEFKAKGLDVLDRVGSGEWESLAITKRGKAVAMLLAPPRAAAGVEGLHGFMRGSVQVAVGVDLVAPVGAEGF